MAISESTRTRESGKRLHQNRILVDADLFISYLTSDHLEKHFKVLVERARETDVEFWCSSEVYDDIATALRSQGIQVDQCSKFLSDTKLIPHQSIPLSPETASKALELYSEFGGRRRLHYFDAFHVATAKDRGMTFYTSDKYVIHNGKKLGINVIDIRTL